MDDSNSQRKKPNNITDVPRGDIMPRQDWNQEKKSQILEVSRVISSIERKTSLRTMWHPTSHPLRRKTSPSNLFIFLKTPIEIYILGDSLFTVPI